jgi:hypothetical protein
MTQSGHDVSAKKLITNNARNDEIRDKITRVKREYEANSNL